MNKKALRTLMVTLLALVCAFGVFALVACGGKGTNVTITMASAYEMRVGGNGSLSYKVEGSKEKVEATVADTSIVSVTSVTSSTIILKGNKQGKTTLTAKLDKATAECEITVTAENIVTIKYGDEDVTGKEIEDEIDIGDNIQLSASSSLGIAIVWSTDSNAVTVDSTGKVTGVRPGSAILTATAQEAKATVTVNVGGGYELVMGEEGGTKAIDTSGNPLDIDLGENMFWYWATNSAWLWYEVNVDYAYYVNSTDTLSFGYTSEGASNDGIKNPAGLQFFYKNSDHTVGNYYKLTCTITMNVSGTIQLNGELFEVEANKPTELTAYYQYTDKFGSGATYGISSFDLVMGYLNDEGKVVFVEAAEVTVSDFKWEDITSSRIQLDAPSFALELTKAGNFDEDIENEYTITITDPNLTNDSKKDGVASYQLVFVGTEGKGNTTLNVKNGDVIDLTPVSMGNYTVYLKAIAARKLWIDSANSTDSADVTVLLGASYEMTIGDENIAKSNPGTWFCWGSDWVEVTGEFKEGKGATITFSNNAGYWYSTQVFYKDPDAVKDTIYGLTLSITSTGAGKITVNNTAVDLIEGTKEYTVYFKQGDGATISIQLSVDGQGNGDITAGTITFNLVSLEEAEVTQLEAPSATITENEGEYTISITDNANAEGTVASYKIILTNKDDESDTYTFTVADGDTLNLSSVKTGTYTVQIYAIGGSIIYTDSELADIDIELEIENDNPVIKYDLLDEGSGTVPEAGNWYYWSDQNWGGSTVTVSSAEYENGTITVTFTSSGTCAYGLQVKYTNPNYVAGTVYSFDIVATADMDIQIGKDNDAKSISLKAGETVTVTGVAKADVYMQVNIKDSLGGTITISNVEWKAPAADNTTDNATDNEDGNATEGTEANAE